MKHTKILVTSTIIMLCVFGSVIYLSCKKASCSGVLCQNGGTCSKGSCKCPPGFSGSSCQLSSILLQNNTFTELNVSVNGSPATIPVGGSIAYSGTPGSKATVTATTSGISSSGLQQGALITWSFADSMPTGGAGFTQPFNVGASYFYLQVVNDDPTQYITSLYVNYGTALQTLDNVSIINDRNVYGIGYYRNTVTTEIYATGTGTGSWALHPSIPDTTNSTVILKFN